MYAGRVEHVSTLGSRHSRPERGDAERTARLLVDDGIVSGRIDGDASLDRSLLRSIGAREIPPAPVRALQAALKNRRPPPELERDVEAAAEVRRQLLGPAAEGPPRFLIRVDEFPHFRAWDDPARFGIERFRRFHEIMREAGVPYLIAGLPRLSRNPLDPDERAWRPLDDAERALLARLPSEQVTIALHGHDHRTRARSSRRHSELSGLDAQATGALLDLAVDELQRASGERARVFIAPYNRFDPAQWPALSARFAVVGGGPESIRTFGVQSTPQWRGDAVFLPAYAPHYGHAREVMPAAQRSVARAAGLWTPIVLHWGWEADAGWQDLKRLAAVLAPHAVKWSDFLAAVDRSR